MKKYLFIALLCFILTVNCLLSAFGSVIHINKNKSAFSTTPTETVTIESPTYKIDSKEPLTLSVGESKVIAISKDEEKTLKEYFKNSKYLPTIMMSLYTGVRPNELSSIVIKDNMIIANNSKRHNKKVETKRIPISKMLKPYITENFKSANPEKVRDEVKKCLPNHKYYDLRTTFYSRCKECGIEIYAIEEYMGHSLGAIGNSYTDLSDEYLIKEMEKFAY